MNREAWSARKQAIFDNWQHQAHARTNWRQKAAFLHREDAAYLRFLIPKGLRVLDLGCATGDTLASLDPAHGVGIDFSPNLIEVARSRHADLAFIVGDVEDPATLAEVKGPFDVILMVDTLGSLDDCQAVLERLNPLCTRETRLILVYYSHLWQPFLKLAEILGLRMRQPPQNVLSPADIELIAGLAGFDAVKFERRLLSPFRLLGIGRFINRFLAPLPLLRALSLRHFTVTRSLPNAIKPLRSATVVVPARNERGNVEAAVQRIPNFCDEIEIVFVEGHSSDGTLAEIRRVKDAYPDRNIKVLEQPGKGKADAVRAGFDIASGDVLMILDCDLTMPPQQLPKFWNALASGKGEFVNGSRLVYPMDDEAMRFLNLVANRIFSYLFSWLLNQRYTDTLCGTKVIRRSDYARLQEGRAYFGDFDPFGDFDLILGASKLNLKTIEVPVRYASRVYGKTQISRFRHGWMLIKMVVFAFLRIKAL